MKIEDVRIGMELTIKNHLFIKQGKVLELINGMVLLAATVPPGHESDGLLVHAHRLEPLPEVTLKQVYDRAIADAVRKHAIEINDLTERQVVDVFKQAIACGDIRRLVRTYSNEQAAVYIPYETEQRLRARIAELESELASARAAGDEKPNRPELDKAMAALQATLLTRGRELIFWAGTAGLEWDDWIKNLSAEQLYMLLRFCDAAGLTI